MWRKNCGPHALADLRRKLQEEKAIFIIFPEGGRSRTGSMMPFKHGLGMLVAETNVPVVPCGLVGTFEALPPEPKCSATCRRSSWLSEIRSSLHRQPTIATGWSQIAAKRRIPRPRSGWSVSHGVVGQLLFQMWWNVGDNHGVVALVAQLQHVTDSMDLGDQRRFIRWNTKTRAQPPRAERVFQRLHEFVNAFSGARGDRDAPGKAFHVRIGQLAVRQDYRSC